METDGYAAQPIRYCKQAMAVMAMAVLPAIISTPPKAQEITLIQVIVRDDNGDPVPREIWQFPPAAPENAIPLDETDDQGQLKLRFVCPQGTRIQARPHSRAFTYSRRMYCRPTLHLRVDPINVAIRLQRNLAIALKSEDFAVATLIATELASIETTKDQGIAGTAAENLAIVYAAEAFRVSGGVFFDPAQGKSVMAPMLQAKVREYQERTGLKVTGQLDYGTLSALAGTTSGALRHFAFEAKTM